MKYSKRINLPVNQGPATQAASHPSDCSALHQGKSIKSQKFIICLFIRGWYLTSFPPPPPAPGSHPSRSLFYHKRNRLVFELDLDLRKSQLNSEWVTISPLQVDTAITSYFKNERPTWITIACTQQPPCSHPETIFLKEFSKLSSADFGCGFHRETDFLWQRSQKMKRRHCFQWKNGVGFVKIRWEIAEISTF